MVLVGTSLRCACKLVYWANGAYPGAVLTASLFADVTRAPVSTACAYKATCRGICPHHDSAGRALQAALDDSALKLLQVASAVARKLSLWPCVCYAQGTTLSCSGEPPRAAARLWDWQKGSRPVFTFSACPHSRLPASSLHCIHDLAGAVLVACGEGGECPNPGALDGGPAHSVAAGWPPGAGG